jgi:fido (protein-threonine AMPylation protein)
VILHDITGTENHEIYRRLEISNGNRQYDFLRSLVEISLAVGRPFLSSAIIKALNFQAITCLHTSAGEYRPCPVTVGEYRPPDHYQVHDLMDDFINQVNRQWENTDAVALASFVLWRLNYIHPFINGNGRTARAASYFVLCVAAGQWLPGKTILPELIRRDREKYVEALKRVDSSVSGGSLDLAALHSLISKLLEEQLVVEPSETPA